MPNANGTADRLASSRRFRAPLAVVGAVVLGLSMLLSSAPVLGAANNGNGNGNGSTPAGNGTSGNVKVHDALTGVETSGIDNEPHVCAFWLGFTFDAPFEAGTWVVVSWPPTGDGSTVASGIYDTAGDGVDSSSVIDVAAGHYRVEWAATGATSSKKKTFWVDADCETSAPPVEEEPAADEPAPPTDSTGSPTEEETSPSDDESQAGEETQAEEAPVIDELVLAGEATPPSDDESQAEEGTPPSDNGSPAHEVAPTGEEGTPPADEPGVDDVAAPVDVLDVEETAQAVDPGSIETGTPPFQDELGAVAGSDEPAMADTAVPAAPVHGGLPATMGLVALIVLGGSLWRDRRSDRDNSTRANAFASPGTIAPNR